MTPMGIKSLQDFQNSSGALHVDGTAQKGVPGRRDGIGQEIRDSLPVAGGA